MFAPPVLAINLPSLVPAFVTLFVVPVLKVSPPPFMFSVEPDVTCR